ncbi:MalY/PatB family protein [Roseovarius aestuariivivens]|uniref:MalY/PatB family protein n=1 Tax=Roseovarius aestuariivivens TaxID=1888910 RepID=UPI001080A10D|nr:PatB family C-S lyase [Roseovarius aestuariivivens]
MTVLYNFDKPIERVGTNCTKWDLMEPAFGVPASDGIPMWVADMDFEAPDVLQEATKSLIEKANYGYFTGEPEMKDAVAWWMETRHGWSPDPRHMFSTAGLGNAIAICIQTFTDPGDEVIIFTPVYHEFTKKIVNADRVVKESPLVIDADGLYRMDLDALGKSLSGKEKMLLFCSPHNPAGRVWTVEEQKALAAFCIRHDLILVSDEIHHDLTFPGQTHVPMPVAAPEVAERLVMLTSSSKTFNTAGSRLGTVTVPGADLRQRFGHALKALNLQANLLGCVLTCAAYSPRGAEWVDQLTRYLDGNRSAFLDAVAQIPGLRPMPMQATYLAWVDFTNTGMEMSEILRRVRNDARIAPSVGDEFGSGGEMFLRFNIGTTRARINTAISRLQDAFSDLQ